MKFKESPQVPSSEGNGGTFLKLKNKETATGIFKGEVHEYYAIWDGNTYAEVSPDEKGAKFRFRINFVINEGGKYVSKIWEQGTIVYNDLKALHEEYNLEETLVKITRNGEGTDTTYSVMPAKNQPTKEQLKKLAGVELNDLNPKPKEKAGKFDSEMPSYTDEDSIPF